MLGTFSWIDWVVVAAFLALTTYVGHRAAGRQSSLRDFFLGGRKLPWYAVSASIVATEISAVTFISLPFVVSRPGGDLTYLQLGIFGSLLARILVAWILVPAYYQREIYSPYDYMGHRLGAGVRGTATALFTLGGVLAQSCRVYLTALVLEVVLHDELQRFAALSGVPPLVASVAAIGVVAVAWTWMGGIATVVWTDAILFLVFVGGLAAAFAAVVAGLDGGAGEVLAAAEAADKLRFFDLSTDPSEPYTLWTAVLASTWMSVGAYGTDQLMAQRMLCCRGPREARKAILGSYVGMAVTALAALVGLGLYAWYRVHPLEGTAAELVAAKGDRIFPVFALQVLPTGVKGLIIAGVFAAAISSLDSILAALSQTTSSALWTEEHRSVRRSRGLVLVFGAVLCAAAVAVQQVHERYPSILDLALAMATYTWGALLAGFVLAFASRRGDGSGYPWAAPISVMTVFALVWHAPWARAVCWSFAGVVVALWIARRVVPGPRDARLAARTALLLLGLAAVLILEAYAVREVVLESGETVRRTLAWPWNVPIGCAVALVLGVGLPRGERAARAE